LDNWDLCRAGVRRCAPFFLEPVQVVLKEMRDTKESTTQCAEDIKDNGEAGKGASSGETEKR